LEAAARPGGPPSAPSADTTNLQHKPGQVKRPPGFSQKSLSARPFNRYKRTRESADGITPTRGKIGTIAVKHKTGTTVINQHKLFDPLLLHNLFEHCDHLTRANLFHRPNPSNSFDENGVL
jgi:hypothetical protein